MLVLNIINNYKILVDNTELVVSRTLDVLKTQHLLLLENAKSMLEILSYVPEVRSGQGSSCNEILASVGEKNANFSVLGVIELDGSISCSSLAYDKNINVSDRQYFQDAVQSGQLSVGEYQIGKVSQVESLNFGYPVKSSDGNVLRVIIVGINLNSLRAIYEKQNLPENTEVLVLDNNATILSNLSNINHFAGSNIGETDLWENILSKQEGVFSHVDSDGVKRLYAFAPLQSDEKISGYIAVGISENYFFASSNKHLSINLFGTILLLSLFFVYYFSRERL